MCSPVVRHARNHDGAFVTPLTFVSSGSQIMVALRRPPATAGATLTDLNEEFIDGAYMFHDGKCEIPAAMSKYLLISRQTTFYVLL